ncbi:MAG: FAD-dependent thymidylate synthase [Armatimonadia bacterium]|nr:FAD-dependent thymidylate synthase [Armatimonadia bacterium]
MTNKIDVLDHGYVRLVDHMGDDLSVVRAARVSHDAAWRTGEDAGKDEKLINFLLKNKHTSPFEHVIFTFEVKAPIFVFRQWHRHRTWSFNEVSARYSELPEEFYLPKAEHIGTQSIDNHQSRDLDQFNDPATDTIPLMKSTMLYAFSAYRELLKQGVPRELARTVLPVATYSKMFATVDLHNLFHFLTLRLHEHAQYEIRVYAEAMYQLIKPIVPVCAKAWENNK